MRRAFWSALLVYPLTQWLGAAAGAGFALCRALSAYGSVWKNSSSQLSRTVRTWKSGLLDICPRIFQSLFWCLGVACGVQRICFLGTRALLGSTVVTCSTGGFGRILHNFYVVVNSNPEAFCLHSRRMESVHSRCFWL